jgi:hypothetical protein
VFQPRSPSTSPIVAHSKGMWPFALGKPLVASAMQAMPLVVWFRPVSREERVGEHNAVVCQFVYVSPDAASFLMFGVSIRPPHGSMAEKPTSSNTMYTTLGAPSGATGWRYGSQSGVESRSSMLMVPLNAFVMPFPPQRNHRSPLCPPSIQQWSRTGSSFGWDETASPCSLTEGPVPFHAVASASVSGRHAVGRERGHG